MIFEYGDAQKIKDKLGKRHILSGIYPMTLLSRGSKEECTDKAKEIIDIMAPGGNFIFGYDKSPVHISDMLPENTIAVNDFVREYGVYK